MNALSHIFRAMTHRNFRLFFIGQCISWIGTWMQQVAMGWLAYRLSHDSFVLGLVTFSAQIPTLFVTPFAGVLADRFNRHKVVICTQTLSMIQAFIVAWLTLAHVVEIWHLIALGLVMGLINSVDMPTRQAFMVQMIDDPLDLPNAIALNSSLVNAARLIGPTVAGVLIAAVGEGWCFFLNGVSYLAVIWALVAMQITPLTYKERRETNIFAHLREGLEYAFGFSPLRSVILLLAAVSFLGQPYSVLMPVFAKDIFHEGAKGLGILMGASGFGALAGAIFLATRKSVMGLGRWLMISTALFGVGLFTFGLAKNFWMACALLMVAGFGMMVEMAGSNTVLQTLTDEDKRGRVMSMYTIAFMGISPFGGLLAGWIAKYIGAPCTVAACGVLSVACAMAFGAALPSIRKAAHPVLIDRGVISPDTPLAK